MADSHKLDEEFNFRFREDEESEFFTELALHESERWIQAVTKKSLQYSDDTRKSLENGVLLCELLNCLQPGSVSRINRLPTPIAGLDNINVFLKACKSKFGLNDAHLFNPSDLEDLSNRAISESVYLKREYEKRLRNVSMTIYWLGKYASQHYDGAQLDLSAYSALIHHHQDPYIVEHGYHTITSRTSSNSSGDWPQGSCNTTVSMQGTLDSLTHSLDGTASDVYSNMYMNRNSSGLTPNKSIEQFQIKQEQNQHRTYSSSSIPDLANRSVTHRRYSSTDSMEGSFCSGQSSHSHQGSDSQELIYPMRRLTSQLSRKQSSSTDPLQYIKVKGAQNLAHTAEVQMRVAAESKKGSVLTQDEEDADWQSELKSWKSRRKSQSERTYYNTNETRTQIERDEAGDSWSAPGSITFSEMQEKREPGRGFRKKFYPINDDGDSNDDDDDDSFAVTGQFDGGLSLASKSMGQQVSSDNLKDNGKAAVEETCVNIDQPNTDTQSDTNNNDRSLLKSQNHVQTSSLSTLTFTGKTFDNDHDIYRKGGSDKMTYWQSAEGLNSMSEDYSGMKQDTAVERGQYLQNDSRAEDLFSDAITESESRRHEVLYKTNNTFSTNNPHSERDVVLKKMNRNIGSRTKSKIGSILKNFEDSMAPKNVPKQGYNEQIDLNVRKSAFENVPENNYRKDMPHYHSESLMSDGCESWNDSLQETESDTTFSVSKTPWTTVSVGTVTTPPKLVSPSSSAQADTNKTDQDFIRKTIKISQKPNSEKGFGFFLSGGVDKQTTLYVSKVVLGSAADVCDLKDQDVVVSVNQTDVSAMSAAQVGDIVAKSVCTGYIEIQVWRQCTDDDIDDFTSSSDEEVNSGGLPRYQIFQTEEIKLHNTDKDIMLNFETNHTDGRHHQDASLDKIEEFIKPELRPPSVLRKWQQQQHENEKDMYDKNRQIHLNVMFPQQDLDRKKDLPVTEDSIIMSAQDRNSYITGLTRQHELQDEQEIKDKTRQLEERRAERRARILQSTAISSSPQAHEYVPKTLQHEMDTAPSPLSTTIGSNSNHSNKNFEPFTDSGFQKTNFVIDTRNKHGFSDTVMPAEYQVRNNFQPIVNSEIASRIEEEINRIRVEELKKLQEERQRAEEELMNREMEDKLRRQKEEEELRKERELLQLEREKFLQEKEEFNRFKKQQQLQQEKKNVQPVIHKQVEDTRTYDNPAQPLHMNNSGINKNSFQNINQRDQNLGFYSSKNHSQQISAHENHQSSFQPISVHATIKLEETHSQNVNTMSELYSQFSSEQRHDISKSSSSSFLNRLPIVRDIQTLPQNDIKSTGSSPILSKEEMLIMNRKAKPMLELSNIAKDSTDQAQFSHTPITREAPSRGQIHSLNSVPMARFRGDADWQSSESYNLPSAPKSVSPQQMKKGTYKAPWVHGSKEKITGKFLLTDAGDHWLVQEAERRRIAESESRIQSKPAGYRLPYVGPIKPADDSPNRWRDHTGLVQDQGQLTERVWSNESMPAVIRQTLLQKTAGTRGSNEPVQSSSHSPSLSYQEHFHSHSLPSKPTQQHHQYPKQQQQRSPLHESLHHSGKDVSPKGQVSAPEEQREMPVNGSQLCSHCDQELGYGAAMVIESLGLYFHVQCFRCWVCHASLGAGDHGADVRVRINKLHCPNCYSNDEAGLKFSKV